MPGPGSTVRAPVCHTPPGARGANPPRAAARAGAKVRMVGAVGKDSFASDALALLRDGKIDLSGVGETFASTGTALIMVGADGENVIAVVPGANDSVVPGDLSKAFVKNGDVVLLQLEIPLQTVEAALDAASTAAAITVLNTAPFHGDAAGFLGKADYLVANETEFDLYGEALSLNGRDRPARMRDYAARTGRTIVVTLGSDGVLAATPDDLLMVPALKITPLDTVGAGDTFCGYFAAGLAAGLPLDQALARAAAAGSLACLKAGAQPAIPLARDVDAALQKSAG
ncbi:PfkB family carbohydrate kinase [Mesorhizobium sp. M1169]|uniref:PfkB family carbohydrate kinase n=1 Tax=Mesorhizobium sp. M1169 TaxID=2957066 RepID=UPI0033383189